MPPTPPLPANWNGIPLLHPFCICSLWITPGRIGELEPDFSHGRTSITPREPGTTVLHLREGLDAGATLSRLTALDLSIPSREIRVPRGRQQSLLERVRPYTVLCGESCASHMTAAQRHGIPLPWLDANIKIIHLTRPAGSAQPRRKNVAGQTNTLVPGDIMFMDGVPVTTPARTFLDLSALLGLDDLVAVADFLFCEHDRPFEPPKIAIVQAATVRRSIGSKHHVRGFAKAAAAVELMRVGVDSPPETKLWLRLRRAGLSDFTTNFAIAGDPEVCPDLACEEDKTSAQSEGEIHKTTQKQLFDRNRDERSAARGWLLVKVYSTDLRRGEAYVEKMFKQALRQQGWPG